jgi:hypothetical protein
MRNRHTHERKSFLQLTAAMRPLSLLAVTLLLSACGGSDTPNYNVTASAGAGGSITPATSSAAKGNTVSLTVSANTGYDIASVTGCGGSLSGSTYTTAALTADCAVTASFKLKQYAVTVTSTAGGSASPTSVNVDHGTTTVITLTPQAGFEVASVTGCAGTLSGSRYTTGAITAACAVNASFSSKKTLTGTAAAGAPVIGKIIVLDSTGKTKETTIDSGGRYNLNIEGLTPPLLINARGSIGSRSVSLSSVAYQADFGGTLNVTPFTDLSVSNSIGLTARGWFDEADLSKLQSAQTEAARAEVTARLLPVLTRFNVPANVDLLRSAFNADHTGVDGAMDILKVEVNQDSKSAVITNLLTGDKLTDSFTMMESDKFADPGELTGVVSDLTAIEQRLKAFAALFATKVPASGDANYLSFFHSSYLDSGSTNPNDILPNFMGIEGFSITQVALQQKISDTQWAMNLTFADKNKTLLGATTWHLVKESGVWKLAGSQQSFELKLHPMVWREGATYHSIIEFDYVTGPSNVAIVHLRGPGLNTNMMNAGPGVIYSVASKSIVTNGALYNAKWLADCAAVANTTCFTRSQLLAGANYTAQAYTANFQPVGKPVTLTLDAIPMEPVLAAKNAGKLFPVISKVTNSAGATVTNKAMAITGGNFTVNWNLPSRNQPACANTVGFEVVGPAGRKSSVNEAVSCGASSAVVSTSAYTSGTPTRAGVWVWLDHETGVSFGEGLSWRN